MITDPPLTLEGPRFRIQLLLTVLGGIGILAIFLNFAWGTSPWAAALAKDLWRVALPFFLPVLVTIASLRWLLSKALSGTERLIAYLVSAVMVCATLSIYVTNDAWPNEFNEWLGFCLHIATLGLGIFALLRTRRNAALCSFRAILSMQIAYLSNCLLCLSSFFDQWQVGAYCSLVTVIVYLTQTMLIWKHGATAAKTCPV
jgi:hypothetical protein